MPPGYLVPSRRFRLHAWATFAGFVLFLSLYFGITVWFGLVAWRSAQRIVSQDHPVGDFLLGLGSLFLFATMIKGVFVVRRGSHDSLREIEESEEPALFEFIRRVAAESGTPVPHRLFLSWRVNAGVFYDMAIWNLLIPSKKNLEIGLGVVNALSMDEFKAVIAHEFGHFSQRTMTVGLWVHLAGQFVGDLVMRRDALDRGLDRFSRIDLRIAWVGWILRLIVWSIRSLCDTLFRGVVALERALSREMEFQADRVAVSVAGSDSISHGLLKMVVADGAWDRAAQFALGELGRKRQVHDLFSLQSGIVERTAAVLGNPLYGRVPPIPPGTAAAHRVFREGLAEVPRMWSTHPPNREREARAKETYIPSVLDDRPAWILFRAPDATRREMTRRFLASVTNDPLPPVVPPEDTLKALDAEYARAHLDRGYRGAYLRPDLARHVDKPDELYDGTDPVPDPLALPPRIAGLYPPSLSDDLDRLRDLVGQREALEGVRHGLLNAPGGIIRFRGREVRRKDLAALIDEVERELRDVDARVRTHDREVRTLHRHAARHLGRGWEEHLAGLAALLHYAEHSFAALEDRQGHLAHVFAVVTADRTVTRKEMETLIEAAQDVRHLLLGLHEHRAAVREPGLATAPDTAAPPAAPEPAAAGHRAPAWADRFPASLDLPAPGAAHIAGGWLAELDGRVQFFLAALGGLRLRSLEALVQAEARVAECLRTGADPGPAPQAAAVPVRYSTLRTGCEQPRLERLGWWEKFKIADGTPATIARFGVAAGVLVPMLFLSWSMGAVTLVVHNGLALPVIVAMPGRRDTVPAHASARWSVPAGAVHLRASTADDREIEQLDGSVASTGTSVYNVAGASILVEHQVTNGQAAAPRVLGPVRWLDSTSDLVLERPTQPVRTEGRTIRILAAMDDVAPTQQLRVLDSPEARVALALVHGRWDSLDHPALPEWLGSAAGQPSFDTVLAARLSEPKPPVTLRRLEMDTASPERRAALCAAHDAAALERPDDPDDVYLATRCMPDGPEAEAAFIANGRKFPHHLWLQWAAVETLAGQADFRGALDMLEHVQGIPDLLESPLRRPLGALLLRLRRATEAAPESASLAGVERLFPGVEDLLVPEAALAPPSTARPYLRAAWHLQHGELERVILVGGLDESERRRLLVLVALSENATRQQVDVGCGLPMEDMTGWPLAWPITALAAREGRENPLAGLSGPAGMQRFDARILPILDPRRLRADPGLLDRAVVGLPLEARGAARAAGIVLLGADAPKSWRKEARAILLPLERPYFR